MLTLGGITTVSVSTAVTLPVPSAPLFVLVNPAAGWALALLLTVVCAYKKGANSNKTQKAAAKLKVLKNWWPTGCSVKLGIFIDDLMRLRKTALYSTGKDAPKFTLLFPSLRLAGISLCQISHAS